MQQAFMVADRIVVLRQGIVAGDRPTSDTTQTEVVGLITGEIEPAPSGQGAETAVPDARQ
jgi:D-xylose transport system ATP-binding protein